MADVAPQRHIRKDPRTGPRTHVDDHRDRVRALVAPTGTETVPLERALGRVLAADVTSPIPLPPFNNSAMDGYAVRSVDLTGATDGDPVRLPVVEDIPAGRLDLPPLQPGTAHRIMTGAQVPPGADAVIPVELTDGGTATAVIFEPVAPGAHIRRAGEDAVAGQRVLAAGGVIDSSRLGLAAAVGADRLTVRARPRVLVLSTGSELVGQGRTLRPGEIYDSNSPMLAAAVRQAGGEPIPVRFVPDDTTAFHAALRPHLDSVDLILTSGGVSAGAYEVVKEALTGTGVEFFLVAMQPGMPQGAGRYRKAGFSVPVIALPGNPVSASVSFEIFVRPALLAAAGHTDVERPRVRASLTTALRSPGGKRQYRRAHYDEPTATVTPIGGPGSHLLASLAASDCLLEIDEDATDLAEGATVTVLRTR